MPAKSKSPSFKGISQRGVRDGAPTKLPAKTSKTGGTIIKTPPKPKSSSKS